MVKPKAEIVKCALHDEVSLEVEHCLNCAPWWTYIRRCPIHKFKLPDSGYCKPCKKYYDTQYR